MQKPGNLSFFLITFLAVILHIQLHAQERNPYSRYRFLEVRGHLGNHLYAGEQLKNILESGYRSVEVRYGWQSNNPGSWQSMLRYPSYGVGWYSGFIGNPDVLGSPSGFYGFISFPLAEFQRHTMVLEPALGITYDLNPYDPDNNSINDAIGSRYNVHFNLNLGGRYRLTNTIDVTYGFDFTHFSNGRIQLPNHGLNMFGPNLGVRYNFYGPLVKRGNRLARPVLDYYRKAGRLGESGFLLYIATGFVQHDEDKGSDKRYSTFSTTMEYQYKFTEKSALSVGIDGFRDNSLKVSLPSQTPNFYGAHLGYDLMFWRLSIRMQTGTYLHRRGWDNKGKFFLRPALKLDLSDHFFLQMGMKTRAGFVADWIEFGIGTAISIRN